MDKGYKLLIIEPDELNSKAFQNIFTNEFKTMIIPELDESILLTEKSEFDTIIIDTNLSNPDLVLLIKELKEKNQFVNIILIIEYDDYAFISKSIESLPIYQYFTKPIDYYELRFTIQKSCEESQLKREKEKLSNEIKKTNFILQQQKIEMTRNFIQLKELQEELIQKEKLTAIGVFTSTIIHDIKNSLGVISGYAEIIAIKNPDYAAFTTKISDEVQNLIVMLQDLLDFVRGSKGENYNFVSTSLIDFNKYTQSVFDDFSKKYSRAEKIFHQGKIKPNYFISIDFLRFRRVFINIVKNGYEACLSSGKEKNKIDILLQQTENECIVSITDNGTGISEENLTHIFEPFFTQGKKNGTGLGLSISKNIIENLKGRIEVESEENIGTTFKLIFPVYTNET